MTISYVLITLVPSSRTVATLGIRRVVCPHPERTDSSCPRGCTFRPMAIGPGKPRPTKALFGSMSSRGYGLLIIAWIIEIFTTIGLRIKKNITTLRIVTRQRNCFSGSGGVNLEIVTVVMKYPYSFQTQFNRTE